MINLKKIPYLSTNPKCSVQDIKLVERSLGKSFPEDYIKFLNQTNGFTSDEVHLYSMKDIIERNITFEVDKYCPDFINIGDDGAGSAILVKNSLFNDNKVYIVGHGVMEQEFIEVLYHDLVSWLEDGCPLEEDE